MSRRAIRVRVPRRVGLRHDAGPADLQAPARSTRVRDLRLVRGRARRAAREGAQAARAAHRLQDPDVSDEGAGEPGFNAHSPRSSDLVRPVGLGRPGSAGLERRSLRDPGRLLAHPRRRHARRPARPAGERSASTSSASTSTGTGSSAVRGEQNWEESDLVLNGLHARGIPAVVGLVGSPRWANGGRTPNFAPGAAAFAEFARTAASRYRWVTQWLVWNEPNQARWLRPTTARRLRPPAPQPRLRGDSRGESAAPRSAAASPPRAPRRPASRR